MIPTFIHALFTLLRAYFRQCAHVSIVESRAQRMMVMGYNGILFQGHACYWPFLLTASYY